MVYLAIILSYLIGAIPTAVWLGKSFYGKDVRQHGSRNSGATNTFRVLGKPAGFAVLFIDVTKGYFAVAMAKLLIQNAEHNALCVIIAGFMCVIGHVYSVYVGFRGGKGVATSLGVYLAINPLPILICLLVFLVLFLATKLVSLASISAASSIPFVSYFLFDQTEIIGIVFNIAIANLVIYSHRKNIKRLWKGTEPKMNLSKAKA